MFDFFWNMSWFIWQDEWEWLSWTIFNFGSGFCNVEVKLTRVLSNFYIHWIRLNFIAFKKLRNHKILEFYDHASTKRVWESSNQTKSNHLSDIIKTTFYINLFQFKFNFYHNVWFLTSSLLFWRKLYYIIVFIAMRILNLSCNRRYGFLFQC